MQLEVISRHPVDKARPTPILFVHGAWQGAWYWDEHFLPYFAERGYAVYALSLRGHGSSAGRERIRWTRMHEYVADVAQVAHQLPRPPVLVGHSMGGWIVQKYLEQHYAPAAILLAAMPPSGPLPFMLDFLRHYPRQFLRLLLTCRICSPDVAHALFFSHDLPRPLVEKYYGRFGPESLASLLDIYLHPVRRRVGKAVPMLVLGAMDDRVFSLPEVVATARLHKAQPEAFPHMAHTMMLEAHWRRVADRSVAWLWEHGI